MFDFEKTKAGYSKEDQEIINKLPYDEQFEFYYGKGRILGEEVETETTTLQCYFTKQDGTLFKLSIPDPDPELENTAIETGMESILAQDVFRPDGIQLVASYSYVIETITKKKHIF